MNLEIDKVLYLINKFIKNDIYEQQVDNSTMNKYQQYYSQNYNKGRNKFSMQRNFDQPSNAKNNTKKLEFSQENLVRGLIANEYLTETLGGEDE